jgi:hypothetical protein
MKYLVLPLATAVFVGTLSVATAAPPNRVTYPNCGDPVYSDAAQCDRVRAAAKKKNALIKHHAIKQPTVAH